MIRNNRRYFWNSILIYAGLVVGISLILVFFNTTRKLGLLGLLIVFCLLVLYFCTLVIKFKIWEIGFKNVVKSIRLIRSLEKQLLEAGIYVEKYTNKNGVKIVDIPKICIEWQDEPVVKIKNSVKFNSKFDGIDFSAGVLNYTVESSYFSLDRNWLILELHDFTKSWRFIFDDFLSFKNEIEKISRNEILIDQALKLKNQHCLIVGRTGSGKSYFLETLILEWLVHDVDLYIADPKNADLSVISEKITGKSATTFNEITELISVFYDEMKSRMTDVRQKLHDQSNKTAFDFGLTEKVLIIDEFGAFSAELQRQKKADRDKIMSQLQHIIFMGRQLGCYLILVLQKTDATTIPTAIRDNMGFKIVLGSNDRTTYQTTFGESASIPKIKMETGNGWYMLDGQELTPHLAETPTINFDFKMAIEKLSTKRSDCAE